MRKKTVVQPISELELQFNGGESLLLRFDTEAFFYFCEDKEDIKAISKSNSITKMCARIVYAAGIANNEDFSYEKAKLLVSEMGVMTVIDIIKDFSESVGSVKNVVPQELQKKIIAEITEMLR